jgi:hypothetical protein
MSPEPRQGYLVRYPSDANNFNISPHFKAREIACPCCQKVIIIPRLFLALENTSERLTPGDVPFIITSGVRCTTHQVALYASINAQRREMGYPPVRVPLVGYHVTGEAVDTVSVCIPGLPGSDEEKDFIKELRNDGWVGVGIQKEVRNREGIVIQQAWAHLDVRNGAPAIWYYSGGRK